jgi:hypothetical protein
MQQIFNQLQSEIRKLKMLSIISLASEYDELDYSSIMDQVKIESSQSLEEFLISGITSGIIAGRMDQEKNKFFVTSTIGRDVRIENLPQIAQLTKEWSARTLSIVEETIKINKNCENKKENEKRNLAALKDEIRSVKEAIKLQDESKKNSRNSHSLPDESQGISFTT